MDITYFVKTKSKDRDAVYQASIKEPGLLCYLDQPLGCRAVMYKVPESEIDLFKAAVYSTLSKLGIEIKHILPSKEHYEDFYRDCDAFRAKWAKINSN